MVEFNARFTTGIVALGLVRRTLPALKSSMGLAPGKLRAFYLGFDAPEHGWPQPADGDPVKLVPLGADGEPARPALLLAESPSALDGYLRAAGATGLSSPSS